MEVYFLKSVACLGILFLFYKLSLENTSLHTTKRFFLLGSLVVSMLIPFVTFTEYVEIQPVVSNTISEIPITTFEPTQAVVQPTNYLPYFLGGVYVLGVLLFSIRFARSIWNLFRKVKHNPSLKKQSIFHVLLKFPVTPHSFFNYIFFNKNDYETDNIPKEVFLHETAHVKQKHSWDLLFVEMFRIVFWFNPLLYFMKRSIKLNHEFLADRTVLDQGADRTVYQTILLDYSSQSSAPAMAHSINYSSFKKRFTVMKTHTTKRAAWLKGLLILPLIAVLMYGFSTTETEFITAEIANTAIQDENTLNLKVTEENKIIFESTLIMLQDLEPLVKKEDYTNAALTVSPHASVPFAKNIVTELVRLDVANCMQVFSPTEGSKSLSREDFDEIMSSVRQKSQGNSEEKVSPHQIALYNRLARKYNAIPVAERKIGWEDLKTLETIYRNMTEEQKSNVQPFPECLPKNQITWEEGYATSYNNGAATNNKKSIVVTINVSEVMVNGKRTSIKNFAKAIDKATRDWTKADFEAAHPSVLVASTPSSFMEQLAVAFKETRYYKLTGENIIPTSPPPPPPAPDAPKVSMTGSEMAPPPPPAPNANGTDIPPPPPPPSAIDHIIEMAKKGAAFYFEEKQITSNKAIELLKNNKSLNVESTGTSSKNPRVKISKKPITLTDEQAKAHTIQKETTLKMILFDPPNLGPQITSKEPKEVLELMLQHNSRLWGQGSEITKGEALSLLKKYKKVVIEIQDSPHDVPSVIFNVLVTKH
ncbi:M56 family metallopeptidase [Marinirhabdus gelatinilytica]|uniref:Beta-lactamase regulating signal transducer with metallopeptidase domain n=1 Tax=Marinirhabdus gelatinilytica TaxID=1703343 RepID=A0A370QKN8_9FLAO|nr:M56 family metallopeptidase [Marinirhabdus gelatinilytica]RDK88902.1 beta-lactamase regulating signal transducer with metallopeptidase domain [Marinirhabdus gelatinilytica]